MVKEKAKAKKDGSDWFPPPNPEDDQYDYEGERRDYFCASRCPILCPLLTIPHLLHTTFPTFAQAPLPLVKRGEGPSPRARKWKVEP
jgi:hypothetical protein